MHDVCPTILFFLSKAILWGGSLNPFLDDATSYFVMLGIIFLSVCLVWLCIDNNYTVCEYWINRIWIGLQGHEHIKMVKQLKYGPRNGDNGKNNRD
jgi:hypothetical protein